jgi:hypothetical protein
MDSRLTENQLNSILQCLIYTFIIFFKELVFFLLWNQPLHDDTPL